MKRTGGHERVFVVTGDHKRTPVVTCGHVKTHVVAGGHVKTHAVTGDMGAATYGPSGPRPPLGKSKLIWICSGSGQIFLFVSLKACF